MSDSNPYKPPQSDELVPLKKIVKRGIGAVTLALLTPVAVIITGAISCGVSIAYMENYQAIPGRRGDPINVALLIWLIPPLLALIVMIALIVRARLQRRTP